MWQVLRLPTRLTICPTASIIPADSKQTAPRADHRLHQFRPGCQRAFQHMAIVAYFSGSVQAYQVQFTAWVVAVRPARCRHCGAEHTVIFWGRYARWVYTETERVRVRIERVRCVGCGVTDALLPSFLHLFRRYTLALIQKAIMLALDGGVWGQALVEAVGPFHQPAPSTLREWVWSFVLSAEAWLLTWLQRRLLTLDPLATLDPGRPPAHLLHIPHTRRREASLAGWQALRLMEQLYAQVRARQPDLVFTAVTLLAFVAASLGTSGRKPRLLWPHAPRAP